MPQAELPMRQDRAAGAAGLKFMLDSAATVSGTRKNGTRYNLACPIDKE
jgi:hypothetical protein